MDILLFALAHRLTLHYIQTLISEISYIDHPDIFILVSDITIYGHAHRLETFTNSKTLTTLHCLNNNFWNIPLSVARYV
jgi:predicted phosphodiesterase